MARKAPQRRLRTDSWRPRRQLSAGAAGRKQESRRPSRRTSTRSRPSKRSCARNVSRPQSTASLRHSAWTSSPTSRHISSPRPPRSVIARSRHSFAGLSPRASSRRARWRRCARRKSPKLRPPCTPTTRSGACSPHARAERSRPPRHGDRPAVPRHRNAPRRAGRAADRRRRFRAEHRTRIGQGPAPASLSVRAQDGAGAGPLPARRAGHRDKARPEFWLGLAGPMTANGVADAVRRRGAAAGIADVHPHRFRHTYAHQWLAAGGNGGRPHAPGRVAQPDDAHPLWRLSRRRTGARSPQEVGSGRSVLIADLCSRSGGARLSVRQTPRRTN